MWASTQTVWAQAWYLKQGWNFLHSTNSLSLNNVIESTWNFSLLCILFLTVIESLIKIDKNQARLANSERVKANLKFTFSWNITDINSNKKFTGNKRITYIFCSHSLTFRYKFLDEDHKEKALFPPIHQ